jgi:hypothetical protein
MASIPVIPRQTDSASIIITLLFLNLTSMELSPSSNRSRVVKIVERFDLKSWIHQGRDQGQLKVVSKFQNMLNSAHYTRHLLQTIQWEYDTQISRGGPI